jgi:hypothetical protein
LGVKEMIESFFEGIVFLMIGLGILGVIIIDQLMLIRKELKRLK